MMTSLSSLGSRSTIARRISSSSSARRCSAVASISRTSGSSPSASSSRAPAAPSSAAAPGGGGGGAGPLLGEPGRGLELAVRATDLGVALAVVDHRGIDDLLRQRVEALLDLTDQVLDHPAARGYYAHAAPQFRARSADYGNLGGPSEGPRAPRRRV